MKITGLAKQILIMSLLGSSAFLFAQEPQHEDTRPSQDAHPETSAPARGETKPAHPDDAKPSKQEDAKPARSEGRPETSNESKPARQEDHGNRAEQPMQHGAQSQHGQSASGRSRGHIPDDQFKSHFGRSHTVVINRPTIVEGQPRFQYSGYWFTIVDPWPGEWAYTDECYIDYIDGEYFLFDLLHPGARIAVFVVM